MIVREQSYARAMPAKTPVDLEHLAVRPLAPDTWPAFADLVARHNGVFGGCWCT